MGLLYHTPFPRLRGRWKQNCLLDMTGPHRTRAESSGGYVHSTCTKSVNQHFSTKCKGVSEPLLLTEELRTADGFKGRESQCSLRMWLLIGQWMIPRPGIGKNNQNVLYKILKQIIRYILKRKFWQSSQRKTHSNFNVVVQMGIIISVQVRNPVLILGTFLPPTSHTQANSSWSYL